MKSLLYSLVASAAMAMTTPLYAIDFSITGACSEKPLLSGEFKTNLEDSVGRISLDILEFYQVPHQGTVHGINTIFNSPTGIDAMEVLSDTKMRAYGWCFSINGKIPDSLASEVFFNKQNDYLHWFYAYSTYDQGVWTDYCVPAYTIKSPQLCK